MDLEVPAFTPTELAHPLRQRRAIRLAQGLGLIREIGDPAQCRRLLSKAAEVRAEQADAAGQCSLSTIDQVTAPDAVLRSGCYASREGSRSALGAAFDSIHREQSQGVLVGSSATVVELLRADTLIQ
jgi:hypothetical protein